MAKRLIPAAALLLMIFTGFWAGCGSSTGSDKPAPLPDQLDRVKKMLSGLAETGDRHVLPNLHSTVDVLKEQHNPHAAELEADVAKLEKIADPTALKAQAAKDLGRLPAEPPPAASP